MRRTRILAVLTTAAALALGGVALPAVADDAPTYTITGTVTDARGALLDGITVSATSTGIGWGSPGYQYVLDITEAGVFEITGLVAGNLRVTAFGSDPDDYWPWDTDLTIGAENPAPELEIELQDPPENVATYSGFVTSTEGGPVEGAAVRLSFTIGGFDGYHVDREATTDATGHYEFEPLPATPTDGSVWPSLTVRASGYYDKQLKVAVVPGPNTRSTRITPIPPGSATISGTVTLDEDAEFSGTAYVSPWSGGTPTTESISTDGDGVAEFSFPSLSDGAYRLQVNVAGAPGVDRRIVIRDGVSVTGVEIGLTSYAVGTGSISGSLVDLRTGQPIEGQSVMVYPAVFTAAPPVFASTGSDGSWTAGDLADGTYFVYVDANVIWPYPDGVVGYEEWGVSEMVVVEDGEAVSGVEIGLTSVVPGTSVLEGRVRDASTYLPVADAEVTLMASRPGFSNVELTTDATGRFEVTDLTPGVYSVEVRAGGYFDKWAAVEVAGDSTALSLLVLPAGAGGSTFDDGVITATVLGLDGEPRDDVTVTVETFEQPSPAYWNSDVDESGVAVVSGVGSGTWKVTAMQQFPGGPTSVFEVLSVEIAEGDSATENVSAVVNQVEGSSIAGQIDVGEFSAEELSVTVYDRHGQFVNFATLEDDGSYVVESLPPGDYYLAMRGGNTITSGSYVEGSGDRSDLGPVEVWWSESGQATLREDADLIEVADGSNLTGIDLEAVAGGTVRADVAIQGPDGSHPLAASRCFQLATYRLDGTDWVDYSVGSDFACGTEPLVVRGLPPGDYTFAVIDEFSGSTAFRTQYFEGADAIGDADSVEVSAGEVEELGTFLVSVPEPGTTLEAIELDQLGIDLTLYEDGIGVEPEGDDLAEGEDADVEVGEEFAGQWVNVSMNSDAVVVGEAWHQVAADGTVAITMPDGLTGSHRLAVADAEGRLIGWTPVAVAEGSSGGTTGGTTGGSTSGGTSGGSYTRPPSTGTGAATPEPTATPTAEPTEVAEPEQSDAPEPEATSGPEAASASADTGWVLWLFVALGGVIVLAVAGVLIFRRLA